MPNVRLHNSNAYPVFRRLVKIIYLLIITLSATVNNAAANPEDILNLSREYLNNKEYHSAITECMRYRFLYPGGKLYAESLLIQGQAYYLGGNYYEGTAALAECYNKFRNNSDGEKALLNLGHMRLVSGSPLFAYRTYQEYLYVYPDGIYREEAHIDLCYALALLNDLKRSESSLKQYREIYPDGKYLEKVKDLQYLIDQEINRPKKSLLLSVTGSIFLPGFGHFYTGHYTTGAFTLATNAALIYLIYDGYRDNNVFRMILFSIMEFSFYQYSLIASVKNVYDYNNKDDFYKAVRLSARYDF